VWPSIYHAPESLGELHGLLNTYGADARMFVGGTDVIVRLRHGAMKPTALIDLKRVQELSARPERQGDSIRIGARVTMTTILGDEEVRRWFPVLLEAAAVVGSIQIRNRATLVGNVCNASPAADTVPVLLVHGAVANIAGPGSPGGERHVPLSEFFVGPGRTVLKSGEVVVSLDLPIPSGPAGAAFGRLIRRRGVDLAVINLCVLLEAGRPARMAFGAVGPTPILSIDATGALAGTREWTAAADEALASMLTPTRPISDVRGGRDYRTAMLPVLSKRAWLAARERLAAASNGSAHD
jgi:carbon-monoxide dehydrogenase medium subunit